MPAKIRTYTGRLVDLLDLRPSDVCIEDIAHALSLEPRFGGHTTVFYPVGMHLINTMGLIRIMTYSAERPMLDKWALMHDAGEAYVKDIMSPLKHSGAMEGYKAIEKHVMGAICYRFRLCMTEPPEVKHADRIMLALEQKVFMNSDDADDDLIEGVPFSVRTKNTPEEVEEEFLSHATNLGLV